MQGKPYNIYQIEDFEAKTAVFENRLAEYIGGI